MITIQIEGVVDSVWDAGNYLEGKVKVGDIITGTYVYDSDTPDSNPSAIGGRYEHHTPPHGIFLSVGGFDFQTDLTSVDFLVEIINNYPPDDDYFLVSKHNIVIPNSVSVGDISWFLYDPLENALTSDVLPEDAPVLDHWHLNDLRIESLRTFSIGAHVTYAVVPEPGTILLFGLVSLLLRKRP
ncbi:MAG: PEP-CTERM sorting domain-containing protein [Planctomycetota bacterium]|nr:PEP-CTERM sorting domain-containing protein [Planctomycetota bacterium]